MWIFFVLFIILWILVTLFLPLKDTIEKRLLKKSPDVPDIIVRDEVEKKNGPDHEQKTTKENSTIDSFKNRSSAYDLYHKSGYCDVCSNIVKPHSAYLVPVDIFYDSAKYREYLKNHPKAKSIIAIKGIDKYISERRMQDKTEYSIICPECIELFEK